MVPRGPNREEGPTTAITINADDCSESASICKLGQRELRCRSFHTLWVVSWVCYHPTPAPVSPFISASEDNLCWSREVRRWTVVDHTISKAQLNAHEQRTPIRQPQRMRARMKCAIIIVRIQPAVRIMVRLGAPRSHRARQAGEDAQPFDDLRGGRATVGAFVVLRHSTLGDISQTVFNI